MFSPTHVYIHKLHRRDINLWKLTLGVLFDLWFHCKSVIFPLCGFVHFEVFCPLAEDPSSPEAPVDSANSGVLTSPQQQMLPINIAQSQLWKRGHSSIAPLLLGFFIAESCRKIILWISSSLFHQNPPGAKIKLQVLRAWILHATSLDYYCQSTQYREEGRREGENWMCKFELCVKSRIF